jgi:16S rRNA (uracil1498-N3)-methyltransferase
VSDTALLVASGALVRGAVLALDDDQVHHLRVRRELSTPHAVRLFDGVGVSATGELRFDGRTVTAQVDAVTAHTRPTTTVLAVAAGDRDRFALVAEKCTELGVTDLVPLDGERVHGVATRLRAEQLDRVRRRAREACKQCGNPWATAVHALSTLDQLREQWQSVHWFLADADGASPQPAVNLATGWIIGPEGGYTAAERSSIVQQLGAVPVRLGPWILRFETAAIAAATWTAATRAPEGVR